MAAPFQVLIAVKHLAEVLVLLSPLLPIPILLNLERWVLSNYAFSSLGIAVVRISFIVLLIFSVWLALALALVYW